MLFDQSHHMVDLLSQGPDALKLLLAPRRSTRFTNFPVEQRQAVRAVQLRRPRHRRRHPVLPRRERASVFVGRAPTANWVQFHAETGGYNVKTTQRRPLAVGTRAARRSSASTTASRSRARTPGRCIEKLNGGPVPDSSSSTWTTINIAGRKVRALRHGMAGAPGLEIWGPYEEREEIRDAILEAGKDFGLRAGRRARLCDQHAGVGLDPVAAAGRLHRREDEDVPRVAAGQRLRGDAARSAAASSRTTSRTTTSRRTSSATARSSSSTTTSSAAKRCEKMAGKPQRRKVTFAWNADDVAQGARARCSSQGEHYKFIDLPLSNYASSSYDR